MTATQHAQPAGRGLVTETVAVLGAGGIMGLPIARNIARAGLPVRAWNRSAGKARPLADDGVYLASSPRDAAQGAGIVITILADEQAVVAAMDGPDGALAAMRDFGPRDAGSASDDQVGPHHPLWVQMSTIGTHSTRRCAELVNRNGVGFVDAPVLGTRQPAEEGKLIVLESGPEEARPRLAPVFDAIGQRTIRAGQAGAGSRLKLVTSSWVAVVAETAVESVALAEGLGVDPELFFDAIEDGTLGLPLIDAIARRFAEGARRHGAADFGAACLISTQNSG